MAAAGSPVGFRDVGAALLDIIDVGVVACDADGRLSYFNRAARLFFGTVPDEALDPDTFPRVFRLFDSSGALLAPDQVPLIRALREGAVDAAQVMSLRPGGRARQFTCSARRLTGPTGAVTGAVVWMRDITGRTAAQLALQDSERMFRTAFVDSPHGFAVAAADGSLIDVNPALCHMLDRTPGYLLQHGLQETEVGSVQARSTREHGLLAAGGRVVWAHVVRSRVAGTDGGDRTLLQVQDVSDRHRADATVGTAIRADPLTGLASRVALADGIQGALAATSAIALLLVDIDDFADVNARFGHEQGDALLAAVAARLVETVDAGDTVARLGADQFVLLCLAPHETGRENASALAQRVLTTIAAPVVLGDVTVRVTASVGVANAEDNLLTAATLLARADTAMYAAKRQGKGRCVDHSRGPSGGDTPGRIERLLRHALTRSDGPQLVVHHQPLWDLASGQVVGTEALARLTDDEGALLAPAAFVPVAERTGLIDALGMAVLEQATRHAVGWKSALPAGRDFSVGVNLSVRQLADPFVVRRVAAALAASGLPPDALVLELTESVFSDSDEHSMVLQELSSLGPRIVIDDFGTGYSSLSYLRRFPVNGIKIDRSFVADLCDNHRDHAVTGALVTLGRDLKVPVIAEGIETAAQLAELQQLGCPLGQGYLFSGPVPAAQIDQLLRTTSAAIVP